MHFHQVQIYISMATTAPFSKQGFYFKRDTLKYQKKPWVVLLRYYVHPVVRPQQNHMHHLVSWLSTLATLPWKASVSAWWETRCHYWVSQCFPADHLPTPGKLKMKKQKQNPDYNRGSLDCNGNSCKKWAWKPYIFWPDDVWSKHCGEIDSRHLVDVLIASSVIQQVKQQL